MKVKSITKKVNHYNQYIWNSLAGILNASEAVIIAMLVTRLSDIRTAGIFAISFAIGNLFMNIGKFGVRTIQASDVTYSFSYEVYKRNRLITTAAMLIVVGVFSFFSLYILDYDYDKVLIIAVINLIYVMESYEDFAWGEYQRKGRIDVGAKLFIFRWIMILTVFAIAISISQNAGLSILLAFVISSIIYFPFLIRVEKKIYYLHEISKKQKSDDFLLFKMAFPLFLVGFLTYILNNLPKYCIDLWYDDIMQAEYGFIAMPVFAIGLLSNFIYAPRIKMLGDLINEDKNGFLIEVKKMVVVTLLISLISVFAAFFIGIPVLSFLYAVDLSMYKMEFMILIVTGALMAFVNYFLTVLTVIREQKKIFAGYIVSVILAFAIMPVMIKKYELFGASMGYGIVLLIQTGIFGIMMCRALKVASCDNLII